MTLVACSRQNAAFDAPTAGGQESGLATTAASSPSDTGNSGLGGSSGMDGSNGASSSGETSGLPEGSSSGGGCQTDDDCPDGTECDNGCTAVCGDMRTVLTEECDDGNDVEGDGCDNDCSFTEIEIGASLWNTCALIEGGRVRCWGENGYGQLGQGQANDTSGDQAWQGGDALLADDVRQLAMGDNHFCAVLDATDTVTCWGEGTFGALGNLGVGIVSTPPAVPVDVGFAVATAVTGQYHTCVRGRAGQVACWGFGPALGYGNGQTMIGDDETPASVGTVPVPAAVALAGGVLAPCIVDGADGIICWGDNQYGQLGLGHANPVGDDEAPGLPPDLPLVFDEPVVAMHGGYQHTCALFDGGLVRCWGRGSMGQLGNGAPDPVGDLPVPTVTEIDPIQLGEPGVIQALSTGDNHNCVLFDDGRAKCWGANNFGQLGTGNTQNIGDDELPSGPEASVVALGELRIIQIEAGGAHTCAVVEGYQVYCWGANDNGQLGLGHTMTVVDPLEGLVPVLVAPR